MTYAAPLRLHPPRSAEAVPRIRSATRDWAERAGLGGSRLDDLLLVVTELAANAVRHGGGAHFEVAVDRHGGELRVTVRDAGCTGNDEGADVGPRRLAESGRGLSIVDSLAREVVVDIGDRHTEVRAALAGVDALPGRDAATLRGVPGP